MTDNEKCSYPECGPTCRKNCPPDDTLRARLDTARVHAHTFKTDLDNALAINDTLRERVAQAESALDIYVANDEKADELLKRAGLDDTLTVIPRLAALIDETVALRERAVELEADRNRMAALAIDNARDTAKLQERIDHLEGERDLVHVDIYEHLLHKAPNMGVALHIDGTAQELVGDVIAWVDKAAEALAGRDVVSLQTFRRVEEERDAAKTEVARLRKLFDDAGQGEHNVLALIDHYQDVAIRAESKQRIDGEHVVMLSHDHAGDNSVHALCAGMVWHDVAEATAAVMTRAVAEGMKQQLWSSSANIDIVDVKTFIKASNSGDLVAALFSDAAEGEAVKDG